MVRGKTDTVCSCVAHTMSIMPLDIQRTTPLEVGKINTVCVGFHIGTFALCIDNVKVR